MKILVPLGCGLLIAGVAFIYVLNVSSNGGLSREQARQREAFLAECQTVMAPFEPVTSPPANPGAAAEEKLDPKELVIGVTLNGESRAYPLNVIDAPERKVLNDSLGTEPILVTWCDQCHTAAVFSRMISGQEELFGCSGLLWRGTLVIYDQATKSFWSHVLGKCVAGKRSGEELQELDSTITTWGNWYDQHPETTIVLAARVTEVLSVDYYTDRVTPANMVLGVRGESKAVGWTYSFLMQNSVYNTTIGSTPVVVLFDPEQMTGKVFSSELEGRRYTFRLEGDAIVDAETGSHWNRLTGKSDAGVMREKSLTPVPCITLFTNHWKYYFPDGTLHDTAELGAP